jgi:murein DD-endopeptidase MepM/ murein hydrolase activator NlpD
LAEEIDSTAMEPTEHPAGLARSRRGLRAAALPVSRSQRPATATRKKRSPMRSLFVVGVITALVGSAAIPAFAAANSTPEARTIQQVAADHAQSLVVGSTQKVETLSRDSYSATTAGEIAKKKAAEAAAARARQAAKVASVSRSSNMDLTMTGPGTGAIRWPLATISSIGDGFLSRGGEHQGVDLLAPGGTPIFAATSGTVKVSSEGYYGYGVAIVIDTVIAGKRVETLYGHMRYGSRQVSTGQHVTVGQPIGRVGSTGRSTANHLHFEVGINGSRIDPLAWLRANAG